DGGRKKNLEGTLLECFFILPVMFLILMKIWKTKPKDPYLQQVEPVEESALQIILKTPDWIAMPLGGLGDGEGRKIWKRTLNWNAFSSFLLCDDSYEHLEDKIQDPYLQQVEPVEESAFADNSEELLIGLQCVIYNMENSKIFPGYENEPYEEDPYDEIQDSYAHQVERINESAFSGHFEKTPIKIQDLKQKKQHLTSALGGLGDGEGRKIWKRTLNWNAFSSFLLCDDSYEHLEDKIQDPYLQQVRPIEESAFADNSEELLIGLQCIFPGYENEPYEEDPYDEIQDSYAHQVEPLGGLGDGEGRKIWKRTLNWNAFSSFLLCYDSYEDLEDKIQDPYLQQVEPVEESAFADNSEELLIGLQCVIYNLENSKIFPGYENEPYEEDPYDEIQDSYAHQVERINESAFSGHFEKTPIKIQDLKQKKIFPGYENEPYEEDPYGEIQDSYAHQVERINESAFSGHFEKTPIKIQDLKQKKGDGEEENLEADFELECFSSFLLCDDSFWKFGRQNPRSYLQQVEPVEESALQIILTPDWIAMRDLGENSKVIKIFPGYENEPYEEDPYDEIQDSYAHQVERINESAFSGHFEKTPIKIQDLKQKTTFFTPYLRENEQEGSKMLTIFTRPEIRSRGENSASKKVELVSDLEVECFLIFPGYENGPYEEDPDDEIQDSYAHQVEPLGGLGDGVGRKIWKRTLNWNAFSSFLLCDDSYEHLEDKIQDPYLQQVEPVEESAFADNSEELLIGLQCVIYNLENSKVISVLIGDF
ncbi:hypothetical protein TNIN_58261, partial [Trichonephila inaurata madagascariensis]